MCPNPEIQYCFHLCCLSLFYHFILLYYCRLWITSQLFNLNMCERTSLFWVGFKALQFLLWSNGKMITQIKPDPLWFHMAGCLAPFHWWKTYGVRTACSFQVLLSVMLSVEDTWLFKCKSWRAVTIRNLSPAVPLATDCSSACQGRLAVPLGRREYACQREYIEGNRWRWRIDGGWWVTAAAFPLCVKMSPLIQPPFPAFPPALPMPVVSVC